MPEQSTTIDPVSIAAEFWQSEDGKSTVAGLRLDRALSHFLAIHPAFAAYGDDEWHTFYTESGTYGDIHNAALDGWPK